MHPEYGFQIAANWPQILKKAVTSQFADVISLSNFVGCRVSLFKISCWSNYYVNFIPGCGVMAVFVYKGLTRNLEIGDWGKFRIPKLPRMSQIKCY